MLLLLLLPLLFVASDEAASAASAAVAAACAPAAASSCAAASAASAADSVVAVAAASAAAALGTGALAHHSMRQVSSEDPGARFCPASAGREWGECVCGYEARPMRSRSNDLLRGRRCTIWCHACYQLRPLTSVVGLCKEAPHALAHSM